MSYDIRFAVKVAGKEDYFAVIGEPEHNSPTYNIGDLWRKAMDFDFEQGKFYPVKELIPHFERCIHELQFNPLAYKNLEPENGWGSAATVMTATLSIMEYLREDGWSRGWNSDLPLDYIYMSW